MVLENFLIDADILWDRAGKELYEKPEARAGRKMRVRVTNRGVVEDLIGYTLNLGWKSTIDETKFGLDAFTAVDITKGVFELAYTAGMLTNTGTLKAALQIVPTVGEPIESNNFVITVVKSAIDAEAIQSETSFTALALALVDVNAWNAALQELGAHKASTSNPHGVTKTQVGLGSVDNTSDANKPVSTATQTALNLKANKVQEAWFTPTLINGWVAFGGAEDGPAYYKDNFGNVKLRGVVKSGTLSVSTFMLPIGYRPAKNKYFAVISNNVPGFVLIDPYGGVIPLAGTSNVFVALDSISFKVD